MAVRRLINQGNLKSVSVLWRVIDARCAESEAGVQDADTRQVLLVVLDASVALRLLPQPLLCICGNKNRHATEGSDFVVGLKDLASYCIQITRRWTSGSKVKPWLWSS